MQNLKLIQKIVVMIKQNTQKTWGDTEHFASGLWWSIFSLFNNTALFF